MAKKIYKAFFTVSFISVLTRGLSFIFKIYLSRKLGAEVIGLYQICISIFMLVLCLSATGIPLYLSRKTAEMEKCNKPTLQETSLITTCLIVGLIITLSAMAIFYACKNYLNFIFTNPRAIPMFLIMLPALISSTIYCVIRGWFWGRKNFFVFSSMELVEEILRIIFTVLLTCGLVSSLKGEIGLAIAFTVSDFVCCLILIIIYIKKGGRLTRPIGYKNLLKTSAPITSIRVFGSLTSSITALLLPIQLLSFGLTASQATALYGQAMGMAMPLLLIPSSIISSLIVVLIPEIASTFAKKQTNKLTSITQCAGKFTLLVSGVFVIIYLCLGEEIGYILYKDSFAGVFVKYSAILILPMGLSGITSSILNSLGLELKTFMVYIFGTFFLLLFILIFPRYLGIYSLTVGLLICHSIICISNICILKKHKNLSLNIILPFLIVVAFIIVGVLLGMWLKYVLFALLNKTVATILIGGILGLVYIGLCFVFNMFDFAIFKHKSLV